METYIYNEDYIKDYEIDEIITRVKAFMLNNDNKVLVVLSAGGIQLPGGHVEKNETYTYTLKREILEETGINIEDSEISVPFFKIQHYIKNYREQNKDVLSNVIYYIIKTDKLPDVTKTNLTECEKNNNLTTKYISFDSFEDYINSYINKSSDKLNEIIIEETLRAFNELKCINKL